jgi:bifunctional UDP-N-acetylglucosamine pyrophosphorylase/glucosamine-1-phosphate N-acetyltransferase
MQEFVDNSSFNFELKLIIQKEQLGTGHAVKIVGDFVKDNFVVINGDNLFSKEDLSSINFEDDYNYVFAIEHETPERFGVLRFDNEFLIGIDEKPEKPVSNIINAGMYKFTPEVFDVLETIKRSPRGEYELTCAIEALAKKKKFKVKKLKDFWVDLGVYEDVPKVEAFVKSMF